MSKASIFKYYKNKQELFIAVVDKFCFSTQNPRNKFTETNGTFAEFTDDQTFTCRLLLFKALNRPLSNIDFLPT